MTSSPHASSYDDHRLDTGVVLWRLVGAPALGAGAAALTARAILSALPLAPWLLDLCVIAAGAAGLLAAGAIAALSPRRRGLTRGGRHAMVPAAIIVLLYIVGAGVGALAGAPVDATWAVIAGSSLALAGSGYVAIRGRRRI